MLPGASRRRRDRADRARRGAARPDRRDRGPAGHGRGGARRSHRAAAREGPARGVPSAAAHLVPRAVAALRSRAPEVDVELTEAEPPEAMALLAAGDADLAVVFGYDEAPGRWRQRAAAPRGWAAPVSPGRRGRPPAGGPASGGAPRRGARALDRRLRPAAAAPALDVDAGNEAGFEPRVQPRQRRLRRRVRDLAARPARRGHLSAALGGLEACRHPGVEVREHAIVRQTRTLGLAHREGAEQVPATASPGPRALLNMAAALRPAGRGGSATRRRVRPRRRRGCGRSARGRTARPGRTPCRRRP